MHKEIFQLFLGFAFLLSVSFMHMVEPTEVVGSEQLQAGKVEVTELENGLSSMWIF